MIIFLFFVLAFKIIAENQDRGWLRLETELENVILVFLPKFLWAALLITLHSLVLLQFSSFLEPPPLHL